MARSLVNRTDSPRLVEGSGWQEVVRAAYFEELYRGRNVLWLGTHEARLIDLLLARGAARVTLVAMGEEQAALKRRYGAGKVQVVPRLAMPAGAGRGDEDVAFVSHGEELFRSLEAEAAGRLSYVLRKAILGALQPDGWLVVAAPNGEAQGAVGAGGGSGVKYFEFVDVLQRDFAHVTMAGQGTMVGATVAPFGEEGAEPRFDAGLVEAGAVEVYVAIAGPRALPLPYGLVQLPLEALVVAPVEAVAVPSATAHQQAEAKRQQAEAAQRDEKLRKAEAAATAEVEALKQSLARARHGLDEARQAALRHAEEMQETRAALAERDAYIVELERSTSVVEELRRELRDAGGRTEDAEGRERAARRRVAELEGTLVRLANGGAPLPEAVVVPASVPASAPVTVPASAPMPDVLAAKDERIAELTARLAEAEERALKLQTKVDDAQREAWAHMRARSEAEAAAAEVREDTVRKLKDARKIANVELMRAMEEAMRKATILKEELTRAERERKDALVALAEARAQSETLRAGFDEEVRVRAAAEAARALEGLERRVVEAERERAQVPDEAAGSKAPVEG